MTIFLTTFFNKNDKKLLKFLIKIIHITGKINDKIYIYMYYNTLTGKCKLKERDYLNKLNLYLETRSLNKYLLSDEKLLHYSTKSLSTSRSR